MLAAFHVTIDGDPQFVLGTTVNVSVQTCRVGIKLLWVEQEDVGLCTIRDVVHVLEHILSDRSALRIHDQLW